MVPDASRTSLGLEYFLWENDEEWNWPDQRLIELGIRECAQIGLIEPHEVEDSTVVRMKKAYPVYDQNYHLNLAIIREYLEGFSNLQTIGRNGLHRYNNQDHSMLTGVYAARNICGECHDVWSVNTEPEYHEEAKVVTLAGDRLIPSLVPSRHGGSTPPNGREADDEKVEKVIAEVFAPLDELALGLAAGVVLGSGLFLATMMMILKGHSHLSLLAQYLWGYNVSWSGAIIGFVEIGAVGFVAGKFFAKLRNWAMALYASLIKSKAEAEENRALLEKV